MKRSPSPEENILTMKSGSTVTTLKTWHHFRAEDHLHLRSPENDLSIYFFETKNAEDYKSILLETWKRLIPSFDLEISQSLSPITTGHWERTFQVVYTTPLSEARFTMAILRTYKGIAYINLVDGKLAGISRRSAELALMSESWKPLGVVENSLEGSVMHEWTQTDIIEFDNFVSDSMHQLEIPGVAVAIINREGDKIFSKAFGFCSIDSNQPLSLDTPFMIGSISKPLTTLLIARLIDEGKLTWDTPISSILPSFSLGDTELTRQLTIRHMVSASTGMPQGGFECIFKYVKPEDRLAEMKTMKPTTALGETFQYSNYMVMAGGFMAAHVAMPQLCLEDAFNLSMKKYVFDPLQMKSSVINPEEVLKYRPALPHSRDLNGKVIKTPLNIERFAYSLAPAGGVWGSVNDLAQYLLLEMNNGEINGKRIVGEEGLLERRKPGIRITADSSYGLCLLVTNDQGLQTVGHNGGTMGFSSDLFFMPKQGIGMVILTNCSYTHPFIAAVKQKWMELTFSVAPKAEQGINNFYDEIQQSAKKAHEMISLAVVPNPSLEALMGEYTNDSLGLAKIARTSDGKHYEMTFKEWKSKIAVQVGKNAEHVIVLVDPPSHPIAPFEFQVHDSELVFEAGQERYVFRVRKIANDNSASTAGDETEEALTPAKGMI